MSLYYHGTIVRNLNELKPYASPFSNLKSPLAPFVKEKYPELWQQSLRDINSHIG